jgi:hypothetical protein
MERSPYSSLQLAASGQPSTQRIIIFVIRLSPAQTLKFPAGGQVLVSPIVTAVQLLVSWPTTALSVVSKAVGGLVFSLAPKSASSHRAEITQNTILKRPNIV